MLCCFYNSGYCVLLWTRALLMFLGWGIPSTANICLPYPGSLFKQECLCSKELSFSSSLCDCECETHETELQWGQERSSLQNLFFCCSIMKLGILMTQDKSGQMGTELCSPVTYSNSHLGWKRVRHCFQLQGLMMHFCNPQLTAPLLCKTNKQIN